MIALGKPFGLKDPGECHRIACVRLRLTPFDMIAIKAARETIVINQQIFLTISKIFSHEPENGYARLFKAAYLRADVGFFHFILKQVFP